MSFHIPQMHIPDNSPEAEIMEANIRRDHVTPEEVVRMAIRGFKVQRRTAKPAAANKS